MLRQNVSRGVRFPRHRSGQRQADLAAKVGTSREMVSRLERGALASMTVANVDRLVTVLGGVLHVEMRWNGEQLDRLIDQAHAAFEEWITAKLRQDGWQVQAEVSFNVYGDRGRCDVVAYHGATETLVVVEVKTGIGDMQQILGALDVKTRLGPQIARQLSWPKPARVIPCLVVADARTARRIVASHRDLLARFAVRGAQARVAPGSEPIAHVRFRLGCAHVRALARFTCAVRSETRASIARQIHTE